MPGNRENVIEKSNTASLSGCSPDNDAGITVAKKS